MSGGSDSQRFVLPVKGSCRTVRHNCRNQLGECGEPARQAEREAVASTRDKGHEQLRRGGGARTCATYWSPVHAEMPLQTRLDVAVVAAASYSPSAHSVWPLHSRSLVGVAGVVSYLGGGANGAGRVADADYI